MKGRAAELDAVYREAVAKTDGILRRNACRMEALRSRELEMLAARRSAVVRHASQNSTQVVEYAARLVEGGGRAVNARGGESLRAEEKSRLARALVDSYQLRSDPEAFSRRVLKSAAVTRHQPSAHDDLRRMVSSYVSKQRALDLQLDGPKPRIGGDAATEKNDFMRMIANM